MRGASAIVCVLWLGCGFHVAASEDAGPQRDGTVDAADAGPDAFVPIPACATDPTYTPAPTGNHRYHVYPNLDYDGGIDRCTQDGAHLAVIDAAPEGLFTAALAGADSWIGLDDLTTEGTFRWVTGSNSSFANFSTGEPNDQGTEDCVYMRPDGTWNDTACEELRPAICECDPAYAPKPTPACRLNQTGSIKLHGRVYTIHTTTQTWDAAEADCATTGATLAVFADQDESDAVDVQFPADSWIGYTDAAVDGTFVWVNGAPAGYTQWASNEPSPSNSKDCVIVNGDWSVIACSGTKKYACECDPNPP